VTTQAGNAYTYDGLGSVFFKLIRRLEKAGKVGQGLTMHGLGHTVGTRLAEAGASDAQIQHVLRHKSADMAQRYRRDANKRRSAAAAIRLLEKPRPDGA